MPEMNGFDATIQIRKNERLSERHIPIVAMTAAAMQGDQERCLMAGMDGYVSKPIRLQDLLVTIDRVVARNFEEELARQNVNHFVITSVTGSRVPKTE